MVLELGAADTCSGIFAQPCFRGLSKANRTSLPASNY
jgi:hypothetical protein